MEGLEGVLMGTPLNLGVAASAQSWAGGGEASAMREVGMGTCAGSGL